MNEGSSLPSAIRPTGRVRAARAVAIATCALVAAASSFVLVDNYEFAGWLLTHPQQEPDAQLEGLHPGYRATIRWLQANGLQRVHSLPYESSPAVYQRLMEMMYPLQLVPTPAEQLPDGALVLVVNDAQLPLPMEPVFRAGVLMIVKVQR